ncbi:MAG: Fe-S cluster assembly protein SufD [Prolixibacteraceae bacterium]|nr:Fe-S cluster assembly protein SufD [Prolixibacteraceae bacterium]MBN2648971.1 Fe-S cluster assembly protein SufD [Prolixibacteraceae bacterium]
MIEKVQYTAAEELIGLFTTNKEMYDEGCPDYMNRARETALEKFKQSGIPSRKHEDYKYTDLRPVFQNDFEVVPRYVEHNVDLHEVFHCDVPKLNTHLIIMINGWYYGQNRKIGQLPEGVICSSLQHAATHHRDIVEKYYNKMAGESNDPMANLNTTMAKDGLFFYVPDNVTIEAPVQIINLMFGKENTFAAQRNLIIMGKNSEARIVFCDHTLNNNYYILNNLSESYIGRDARFGFYSVQNQHNGAVNITNFFGKIEGNAQLDTDVVTLNGGIVRNNLKVVLNGEHAHANMNGLSFTDNTQHVDNFTAVDHAVPNCTSSQLYKNILDDKSKGAFTGQIHVFRDAQKTEAFQQNNNVLLSENAEMNTKPRLVIDADDVRCSHGATVGRIDEEALFYLRTRGIGEKEARLMIMYAFADEVLSQVGVDVLRERLEELVDRRLRGELGPCQNCSFKHGRR